MFIILLVFLKLCNQRLKDQYVSNWNTSMSSSADGKLYRLIKENIICSKVQKHKFVYIKFLTKNCNIPVVSGEWYHRKVYNERMCTACNVLGDEYQFVIESQINTDIRSTYLSPYYLPKSSMSKFIELMTCDRCSIISKLAVFIFESLKLLTEPSYEILLSYLLLYLLVKTHTLFFLHIVYCKCTQAPRNLLLFFNKPLIDCLS